MSIYLKIQYPIFNSLRKFLKNPLHAPAHASHVAIGLSFLLTRLGYKFPLEETPPPLGPRFSINNFLRASFIYKLNDTLLLKVGKIRGSRGFWKDPEVLASYSRKHAIKGFILFLRVG